MRILAVGAHLDDIELSCGGVLARAVKNGYQVKMLVMTHSAYTNFDGTVLRTKEEALREGIAAAERLGIKDLQILNFDTKRVSHGAESVEAIDKAISAFKPAYIFTHWVHDTHQDHRNTALATLSAARYQNNILMYEPFPPSGRSYAAFRPQVYVDITDTLEDKINSMKEHRSQYNKYGEDWVEAIIGRARMRGFESGYKYAEVFELARMDLRV